MGAGKETETSLLLKVNWEMKVLYHFRREDFHPKPAVDSVLVHFSRKAVPDLNKKECAAFHEIRYLREEGSAYKKAGIRGVKAGGAAACP